MIVGWAVVLGLVGFACGFIGPIVISPESNQGPLLGIFITGPGGALFGAVLGAIARSLAWTARTRARALSGAAIALSLGTLYVCIPPPSHLSDLVDGQIRACQDPNDLRAAAVARLNAVEASRPDSRTVQWDERFDQSLNERPGVVIEVHVQRVKQLFERRARWNHGELVSGPWTPVDRNTSYFVERPGMDCSSNAIGTRSVLATHGSTNLWRPQGIAEILGLQTAEPLPAKYSWLALER